MEKFEKIIELIEKENLSPEEYQRLNSLTESDKDSKRLLEVYRSLKSDLPGSVHIDLDLLSSFLLYEKGIKPDDNLVLLLTDKIKSHLKSCHACKEEYDFLAESYADVKQHLDNTFVPAEDADKNSANNYSSVFWRKFSNYKYAFAIVTAVFVLYISLFTISSLTTPYYEKGLFSEQTDEIYKTRGRTSLIFQKGLDALDKGNTSDALKYFNQDLEQYGNEKSIFYTHYILGMVYLKTAESNFLGLFNNFNEEKVRLAIMNLQLSIDKNTSGNYNNLKLDAYYYLGRSYLVVNEDETAKKCFDIVINEKGRFYSEAKNIIDTMNKN